MAVGSSRRAGRVTNKTRLVIYRGSDQVELSSAEVIVWETDPTSSEPTKHQHVGAKGVESGELLEHHLQAALSSASLLHSTLPTSPPKPTHSQLRNVKESTIPTSTSTSNSTNNNTLAYHIPTPDATGLVENADYARLYQTHKYFEPINYIKFSDTVEEACQGIGGLGYCMDEEDLKWLNEFNEKGEGGSGSPLKETSMNQPLSAGRERRKGKEKEKEKDKDKETQMVLEIKMDIFEFVMGVLEKYVEDMVPMVHTNLSLLPTFTDVESFFSTPIPASFFPSNELPKGLPELKVLTRMARCIYPHWKVRRERRKGKSIMPGLNYDETNDNDPYVCFRRRDIRATRKTRRTDNYSVEQFQKLQGEMRMAHMISQMVVQREHHKRALYQSEREVWESKWKLFETKRRWPSLGVTPQEEEFITGRPQVGIISTQTQSFVNGHLALQQQQQNIPQIRKKGLDREKEERERRDRVVENRLEKGLNKGLNLSELLREKLAQRENRLLEGLNRKKEGDNQWDDYTDSSYNPLPSRLSSHGFRPLSALDPTVESSGQGEDLEEELRPLTFRLRRGRGGMLRLDRRPPSSTTNSQHLADRLFPQIFPSVLGKRHRPRSIDEVEDQSSPFGQVKKLNEIWRYATATGSTGVGLGPNPIDSNTVIIDDFDPKYLRYRITLLQSEDLQKLVPDPTLLDQTKDILDEPIELPPTPVFVRPQPQMGINVNPQFMLQQQQMLHQQQAEYQRFQLLAQQQAMAAQQMVQVQQQAVQAVLQQQNQTQNQNQNQNQNPRITSNPSNTSNSSNINNPSDSNGQYVGSPGGQMQLKLPPHAQARLAQGPGR
ncbi:hypothetical protein TREMEDRAFT_33468 [Tremella mesenterica DSM 1558]|uniref:uncharacterized protein n=1 Tax=Tremella mesenterica (strain ATCC 24925 / CBS 8224 / DSM 1558 / NBRC 9311 / NRRL Y-6157 / RJB 2259-6 / UBC 559-6) TaxID=578456 RepID=UPI0003F49CD4|nr:uncharacterized protein TREMEDRAFT_33468 [Tremella mesenterica DSM 1558]EIW67543.1 hypothetical protein TREMEDRAFT_33468 [Tremella mesenterica DSM 1558]